MIDDKLRPIVTEFVAEMLNDPHCESILLDAGEDARQGIDQPVLYLDVAGERYGCTLSIVGEGYSATIRNAGLDETIVVVKRGAGSWELRELLGEIKTKLWEDK